MSKSNTKKIDFKLATKIAKIFDIKLKKHSDKTWGGLAYPSYNEISINLEISDWSTFFHELAHIIDFRNNIYLKYYTDDSLSYILKYGYKAEKHTDETGCKLMKLFFPEMKFRFYYKFKYAKKYYYENYISSIKQYIKNV